MKNTGLALHIYLAQHELESVDNMLLSQSVCHSPVWFIHFACMPGANACMGRQLSCVQMLLACLTFPGALLQFSSYLVW